MRAAAKVALWLVFGGLLALLFVGLVAVAEQHSVWLALAIFPGMPAAGLGLVALATAAYGPRRD